MDLRGVNEVTLAFLNELGYGTVLPEMVSKEESESEKTGRLFEKMAAKMQTCGDFSLLQRIDRFLVAAEDIFEESKIPPQDRKASEKIRSSIEKMHRVIQEKLSPPSEKKVCLDIKSGNTISIPNELTDKFPESSYLAHMKSFQGKKSECTYTIPDVLTEGKSPSEQEAVRKIFQDAVSYLLWLNHPDEFENTLNIRKYPDEAKGVFFHFLEDLWPCNSLVHTPPDVKEAIISYCLTHSEVKISSSEIRGFFNEKSPTMEDLEASMQFLFICMGCCQNTKLIIHDALTFDLPGGVAGVLGSLPSAIKTNIRTLEIRLGSRVGKGDLEVHDISRYDFSGFSRLKNLTIDNGVFGCHGDVTRIKGKIIGTTQALDSLPKREESVLETLQCIDIQDPESSPDLTPFSCLRSYSFPFCKFRQVLTLPRQILENRTIWDASDILSRERAIEEIDSDDW